MSTWQTQAEAEGLTLLVADNATGYLGVCHLPGRSKPYKAQVKRGGQMVHLGCFATAEEAALVRARALANLSEYRLTGRLVHVSKIA